MNLAPWIKILTTAASMVAAGAIAWGVLTSRVEAHGRTLDEHGSRLHALERESVEQDRRMLNLEWNGYLSCKRSSSAAGEPPTDCRLPSGR